MDSENQPKDDNPGPSRISQQDTNLPEYEDAFAEIEKVTPSVNMIDYIFGDGLIITESARQWFTRYSEESTSKVAAVELLIMMIEACIGKIKEQEEFLKLEGISEDNVHRYFPDKQELFEMDIIMSVSIISLYAQIAQMVYVPYKCSDQIVNNLYAFWKELFSHEPSLFYGEPFEKCIDYVIKLSSEEACSENAICVGMKILDFYIEISKSIEDVESLKRMLMKIFQGLFMIHYEDENEHIRKICVDGYTNMKQNYPSILNKKLYPDMCNFFEEQLEKAHAEAPTG